ncbi:MAG: NAD(P)/FAD-dependent oxidoreductase [Oscillospiraceae bacterium]
MPDILIIGSGPAGITAALYAVRSGIGTKIITKGVGSLLKAELIENYYGFKEPISGETLYAEGIAQATRLGVSFVTDEVVGLSFEDKLTASAKENKYAADAIVLAMGAARNVPKIENLTKLEGAGVSYCAVCDGFFYRGKNVAVLGSGEYALHEVMELLPLAKTVTLLTDGVEPTVKLPEGLAVDTRKITSLDGGDRLSAAILDGGGRVDIEGLFVAQGVAGSADLARKIGAMTDGNRIKVDEKMATNVPGLFAAGDCTGGMLQIAKAVYEGAQAGASAVKYVRSIAKK